MSQETWEIVQDKSIDGMELQLALQCAPLIAGLKISNLLNISREDFRKLKEIIKDSHISWCLWMETEYKMTILLYHRQSLEDYIRQERVRGLLRELGYRSFNVEDILEEFRMRYEQYMREESGFPHEMGLLLGYPAEDVEGFMRNKGANFLYTGYWKVYEDKERKLKLFERVERATESMVQLLSAGIGMEEIIRSCCNYMKADILHSSSDTFAVCSIQMSY